MTTKVEKLQFGTETSKILHLMIHSLYSDKEIFLRELISNASDACDKLRYLSLQDSALVNNSEFKILINADKENNVLQIIDNGVGMNRQDLIDNLGTIAKSGTQAFIESIDKGTKDINLIGQFGVGFYSAFMVADEITVYTRKAGDKESWIWKSQGNGDFTIEQAEEEFNVGTKIELKLREDTKEFVDRFRIQHIVRIYSDHISYPIEFKESDSDEIEVLNSASALWTKSKSEISDEDYEKFYHANAHAADKPWVILHNKAEGNINYTNLLFIPSVKPFDLFHPDRMTRVKLYVKRVFIADQGVELLPKYLRFVKGIIDSDDLPLNISRQSLQHNAMINKITKAITNKIFTELGKKLEKERDDYIKFWENFGAVLKEGLCEYSREYQNKIFDIALFRSTKFPDQYITLDEYVSRMKEGQKEIFYVTGNSVESLIDSPKLEGFKQNDIEVLLLVDHVDDFWVTTVQMFKEKYFKSITRSDINLDKIINPSTNNEDEDKKDDNISEEKAENKEYEKLINFIKETLGDDIADAKISNKLTSSPACLAVAEGAMDMRMERFLVDQKQLPSISNKILEINPKHKIIEAINEKIESNKQLCTDLVKTIFDQACIIEGEEIKNMNDFAKRLNSILEKVAA